ncbi:hypothetical protein ACFYYB_26270 [Streptomyces sp. NPDC002886]|uniref:hypothetical protein n=1 Tax=Streptomyces sp. NPDC002886 TaxID=3364667 RepID=UPI00367523BC
MTPTLLFVHGRSQHGKDPDKLQRKWLAGLAAGLVLAERQPANNVPVAFPFYGDVLKQLEHELALSDTDINLESLHRDRRDGADPFHPELGTKVGRVERQLLQDLASGSSNEGATLVQKETQNESLEDLLSWRGARRVLRWFADSTRLDSGIIELFLRDVAVYLTHAREEVLEEVRKSVPKTGPVVLVSHSLGTVVARDLLADASLRARTKLWITAGSPLGLDTVVRNLPDDEQKHPEVSWVDTFDVNDVVATGRPLTLRWGQPITEIKVDNKEEPHAIERYLAHSEVAAEIADALGLGPSR